jgi:hypothetical protein
MSELTYWAGDVCCFVLISLENNGAETKSGLTICKEEFDSALDFVGGRVRSQQKEKDVLTAPTQLFEGCSRFEVGASVLYLYKVATISLSAQAIVDGNELAWQGHLHMEKGLWRNVLYDFLSCHISKC